MREGLRRFLESARTAGSIGLAILAVACSRSGLELAHVEVSGTGGSVGGGRSQSSGGAPTPAGGGLGGSAVVAGAGGAPMQSAGGAPMSTGGAQSAGGTMGTQPIACDEGAPTWSCAPAVMTGPCCDANFSFNPKCSDTCQLADNPQGLPCDAPGLSTAGAVTAGISAHCENPWFACYASTCSCGCRNGATASVPGLRDTCERVVFSNAHYFPLHITLDGDFVYWTVAGLCR